MSKVSGKAGGKGGSSKNKSKGQDVVVKKEKKMQSSAAGDALFTIRKALFEDDGEDKDVTKEIQSLMQFKKNGLNLTFSFTTSLSRRIQQSCFKMSKDALQAIYDDSGYGWEDEEKESELKDKSGRFILIRDTEEQLVGFVHFHFTVAGDVIEEMSGPSSLLLSELQVHPSIQRKGVGRYVMSLLELIAKKNNIEAMVMMMHCGVKPMQQLLCNHLKGYSVSSTYVPEEELMQVWMKHFNDASKGKSKSKAKGDTKTAAATLSEETKGAILADKTNNTTPNTDAAGDSPKKKNKKKKKKKKNATDDGVTSDDKAEEPNEFEFAFASEGPAAAAVESPAVDFSSMISQGQWALDVQTEPEAK